MVPGRAEPYVFGREWRGHGFCGYAAQSAPVMASRSVSASRATIGLGATGGYSVMADRTRGQAHVPAQLGLARTCLVLGLAAPASGSTWSCPPRSSGDKKPGPCAATGGTGRRRSAAPGCISSACGSSVQVGSKDRWRFSTWQKTGNTGEPVAANNVWAQASPGQASLPPASCVAASASRPVGQA